MLDFLKKTAKEVFLCEPGVSLEIQEHMSMYYSEMIEKESEYPKTVTMSWKYSWSDFDSSQHVDPLCDRLLYLKKGKKLTPGRVYRINKIEMRQQDYSASAMISDIGTAYSLDEIERRFPIYALARDHERVMIFRWIP